MVFWEGYLSDDAMSIIAPVVVYWLYAGVYHMLPPLDDYRLHTKKEFAAKDVVPLPTVVKGVLIQQFIQTITLASSMYLMDNSMLSTSKVVVQPSFPVQVWQFVVAMLVMDAWQYFVHRHMHTNKFLYKNIHSQHHTLEVPYACGALYAHPLESLIDTLGGVVCFLISGMTARTAVYFFCFTTMKAIDVHSGLWLPTGFRLFQRLFGNNSAYHDIHHYGLRGRKYNYAQPFFIFWDKLFGTYMPYTVVKRPKGGFKVKLLN
ncbi:hypothetical protein MKW94_018515 [Papaver nudicaule]|uniref:Fatty acid hydroxylase domain-containing protein n=1 Tax=Papaver nudicaule TaxID=74823 RepID=A0AA41SP35_PAPNU|nr:hypothetical protein [Papaver nudicaule]